MKRFLTFLFIMAIVSLISFGCTNDTPQNGDGDQKPPSTEGAIEDQDQIDENKAGQNKEIEGTFTGWIDNNSFEIMADDNPIAIRTNPDVTLPDDSLEGKQVRISFTTNEQGQNILQSIEVLK